MGHLAHVGHHRCARYVLAQCEGQWRSGLPVFVRVEDLLEAHHFPAFVGDLDTHHRLAGDDLQTTDLANFYAISRLQFEACHHGARQDRADFGVDTEVGQLLLQES